MTQITTPTRDGQLRRFRPLSVKVVGWVLLFSTVFTLLMTAGLIGIRYLEERDQAQEQLRFAAASYRDSLASSLWELDMPAARLQLDALTHFPMVGAVELSTTIGQHFRADKNPGKGGNHAAVPARTSASWRESLVSPAHPEMEVGELVVFVDQDALLRHLQADALRILGGEAIKGFALALLITWLITRLVTRHLSHIALHAASLEPGTQDQPVMLERRRGNSDDELDQLRDAINQLNRVQADYIRRQQLLEIELRAHRDGLSDMVALRTRSLERLQEFHGLIIAVLTRFINLPLEQEDAAIDEGLAAFSAYFKARRCLLFARDEGAHGFRIVNCWPPLATIGADANPLLAETDLPRGMLDVANPVVWSNVDADVTAPDNRLAALLGAAVYSMASVAVHGQPLGLLCLAGQAQGVQGEDNIMLELAARVAGNMLDHKARQLNLLQTQQALQQVNRELHALSRHDPLTALANRRHFDEVKEAEFRRAVRGGLPLSVMMCDIDEFKQYNDTYGHAQGDRCLKAISACLSHQFSRAGEFPARLGGEEFAVLLPNTDCEHAAKLAELLRQAVWDLNLAHGASSVAARVTISVGVACLDPGLHPDFDSLLHTADNALYRAKAGNRNRVVVAG